MMRRVFSPTGITTRHLFALAVPVEWRLDRCEDFTTDSPDYSSELCVVAKSEKISQSTEKSLTLILAVGGWSQSGEGRWVIRPPAIRELFIQTDANSLDIRSLGASLTGRHRHFQGQGPQHGEARRAAGRNQVRRFL
jgi:hypothetical protein